MVTTHIGCSGFHYKHWRGSFYPDKLAQKHWFSYYCEYFNTLELNVTFYRFPRIENLQQWYNTSPAGFQFAVKAPRAITQFKKFVGTQGMLQDFYTAVKDGLQDKCACCLFQMPPNFQYSGEKLQRIINSLDPCMNNVVEFRHPSWWNEEVFEVFKAHNISFCGMSHPNFPADLINTSALLYYRFHGDEQVYASSYTHEALTLFSKILLSNRNVKQAFIYFNNDINTHAVYNAKELKRILGSF
jgi:uncharacterized protein YecE (DUF72 family)